MGSSVGSFELRGAPDPLHQPDTFEQVDVLVKWRNPALDHQPRFEFPGRVAVVQDKSVGHLFQTQFSIEVWTIMKGGSSKSIGYPRRYVQEVQAAFFLLRQSMLEIRNHDTNQTENIKMNRLDPPREVLMGPLDILAYTIDVLTDSTE